MFDWLNNLKKRHLNKSNPNDRDRLSPFIEPLSEKHAGALREPLKQALNRNMAFPWKSLLELAQQNDWSKIEREKLTAYGEFFSGQSAAAYQRIMAHGLVKHDYELFMTACTYCYLFDRFEEGYTLLKQFEPSQIEQIDLEKYLSFAGYIAFAGGGSAEEALQYFDQALDKGLISPLLVVNAYPIYFEAGRLERVNQLQQLFHDRYSEDQEAIYALSHIELARDYYPEGFRLAEARYQMPEVARSLNATLLAQPRWQGEVLTGKRLLVHGEQGYGDIVMMARYLPLLQQQGASIIVDCREPAIPLLAHNFPNCEFIAGDLKTAIDAPFDIWTGIMSLPYHFNTTANTVPATAGYLKVPPEQIVYWQQRVSELTQGNTAKIGLAWSGNPSHRADRRRSMRFDSLSPYLQSFSKIDFFALQVNVPATTPANVISVSEEMLTLADTAALIAEMDLVITVDTSIVHIAGALGKPTWLLLPYRYEWRWSLEGEHNNWYDSVRVLRQTSHGDWPSLLDLVFGRELPNWLNAHS